MESEVQALPIEHTLVPSEEQRSNRIYRWVEFFSAVMLALATVATAWCGYQSARWGGKDARHQLQAASAIVRTGKFANLAEQKLNLHVGLFGQWAAAVSTGNTALADFLFHRFPEPLKRATIAWQATQPLTNPAAPASPFAMPDYVLQENAEVDRWEATAAVESEAATNASEIADRYLLFTIIFASVLFFGGISGKFRWQVIDVAVLVLGVIALCAGLVVVFSTPIL